MARDAAPTTGLDDGREEGLSHFLATTSPAGPAGSSLHTAATSQDNHDQPQHRRQHDSSSGGGSSRNVAIPSTTGPVGEPGLPPARPSQNMTVNSSRMGTRTGPASRRAPSSVSVDPTPPSSAASRTHVPNIISSAFLRPISSKRAQQDADSLRPTSLPSQPVPVMRPSSQGDQRSHRHRNSNASIVTVEGQQRPLIDPNAPPLPTSRGTVTTTRDTPTADTNRVGSIGSGTSLAPLQNPQIPDPLQVGTQTRSSSVQPQKSPRSPRSLHASWGRQSRSGRFNEHNTWHEGHTKLASSPPSPSGYAHEKQSTPNKAVDVGRNYEYYNGNAVFFLKGRLINSRQRPLNILTAFIAVLPAILFFIFS